MTKRCRRSWVRNQPPAVCLYFFCQITSLIDENKAFSCECREEERRGRKDVWKRERAQKSCSPEGMPGDTRCVDCQDGGRLQSQDLRERGCAARRLVRKERWSEYCQTAMGSQKTNIELRATKYSLPNTTNINYLPEMSTSTTPALFYTGNRCRRSRAAGGMWAKYILAFRAAKIEVRLYPPEQKTYYYFTTNLKICLLPPRKKWGRVIYQRKKTEPSVL